MKNDENQDEALTPDLAEKSNTDRKLHLLEKAEELFAEHGFDGTPVRMIAEKAGMNVAMISYYFGSKEKLLEELIANKINYMRGQLASLMGNEELDAWQKFEVVIESYAKRIITSNGAFHKLMMREISLGKRTEISKLIEEKMTFNMQAIYAIFTEGIEKKIFSPDIDFTMIMSTILGTITYTTTSKQMFCRFVELEGKGTTDVEDLKAKSIRVQMHLKKVFARYMLIHPENYNY